MPQFSAILPSGKVTTGITTKSFYTSSGEKCDTGGRDNVLGINAMLSIPYQLSDYPETNNPYVREENFLNDKLEYFIQVKDNFLAKKNQCISIRNFWQVKRTDCNGFRFMGVQKDCSCCSAYCYKKKRIIKSIAADYEANVLDWNLAVAQAELAIIATTNQILDNEGDIAQWLLDRANELSHEQDEAATQVYIAQANAEMVRAQLIRERGEAEARLLKLSTIAVPVLLLIVGAAWFYLKKK